MFNSKLKKLKRKVKNCKYCQSHYGWCVECQKNIAEIEKIVRTNHPIKRNIKCIQ